jgi:predicted acyltransferase
MTTTYPAAPPPRPQPYPQPTTLPAIEVPPVPGERRSERLVSLDVFRGITIAAMLLVNNPGKGTAYAPLEHAEWHGWTPTDLIFPFFLFIVGVAIPFSMAKRSANATVSRGGMFLKIWGRALSLFMLGELLQGFPFLRFEPVPAGFEMIHYLRIAAWALCGVGIIVLLLPWKSPVMSVVMPLMIAGLFYGLAFAIHYTNIQSLNNGLPATFNFGNGLLRPDHLRIPGVLQRIGVCYGVAATIALFFNWQMCLAAAVFFCAVYSGLMLHAPFHDDHHAKDLEVGSLAKEDNFARRVDENVFNRYRPAADGSGWEITVQHAYGEYPDNEGIVSTLPAIASVLLGFCVGAWLRSFRAVGERCSGLLVFGIFTLLLGLALNRWLMPINKNIWTPSFTVFTAGMGMLMLGMCFYFVDVLGYWRWALPFKIYGMNAIAAFVFGGLVTRALYLIKLQPHGYDKPVMLMTFIKDWSADLVARLADSLQHTAVQLSINTPQNTSLAYSLLYVLAILALMSVLYVFKIFIKV